MTILDLLQLNDAQHEAVATPGHVVVTAGAGSGKTRTLVGRYLYHLEAGVPLRSIVAITFTEKAAREMRTRIRKYIADWLAQVDDPDRRPFWETVFADLDAARIGTIHSLCAQILREHPVEAARLDVHPGFGVLEEGRAAVLQARAVDDGLAWAAEDERASHLFRSWTEFQLRATVSTLLEKRLDADPGFARLTDDPLEGWSGALLGYLDRCLDDEVWRSAVDDLVGLCADDPTDKMECARQEVLAHAEAAQAALRRSDVGAALAELAAVRESTTLYGRKANWPDDTLAVAKNAMQALRAFFEAQLAPLADPRRQISWELDEQVAGLIWLLQAVYRRAGESYARGRRMGNSLDFDDLEGRALTLLREPDVRAAWQKKVRAVLVDEFQDTNERQREIVYLLTGFNELSAADRPPPAALFVVGDAKQSIYRFRGADVTVFRRVQQDVAAAGGQVVSLDRTFRAHHALVEDTNSLLAPVLGQVERPARPYEVPFASLQAHRPDPAGGVAAPFVEFHLGLGPTASAGRQAAAEGLAARLHELRAHEAVEWSDVALLFRASTAFPVYEDELERAGIPFVTVAGRGFYDRPEIRDLLNALTAVADPTDDLALVGFLRSPAIGLSDGALYSLRYPPAELVPRDEHQPCEMWSVLHHPALPDVVPPEDLAPAVRGRDLVRELHRLSGRLSVAALLKRLLDRTHYRAILQAGAGGIRSRRNVDKLLADAHASGLVSVREFLEYVRTLRDVGVRESEAPTEAGSAVQLMTVHKAKGLEFPVVVIADAAHAGYSRSADVLLDESLGVAVNLRDEEGGRSAVYSLAHLRHTRRDEAEDRRLLYVAATRAREKLLVSGHTRILKGGRLSLSGWMDLLGQTVGLDGVAVAGTPAAAQELELEGRVEVRCTLYPWREEQVADVGLEGTSSVSRPVSRDAPLVSQDLPQDLPQDLVAPLIAPPSDVSDAESERGGRESQPPSRAWRVVPVARRPEGPAWVVGTLVHVALRHWRFPDRPGLEALLRPHALEAGLTDAEQIRHTIGQATRLLARFQNHPFYAALDRAERRHEVPYTVVLDGRPTSGVVDLLARLHPHTEEGWTLVEFKTDELKDISALEAHVRQKKYDRQIGEYVIALDRLLGQRPRAVLVFLNVGGKVEAVELDTLAKWGKIQLLNFG